MVNAFAPEVFSPPHVVPVEGVPAVYDGVAGIEKLAQLRDRVLGDLSGRQHDPNRPRPAQCGNEPLQSGGADDTPVNDGFHGLRRPVKNDALMSVACQATHHVGTHASEADHTELHLAVSV